MFTIFHLLEIIGIVAGLYVGFIFGYKNLDWFGIIGSTFGGGILGFIFAKLPFWIGFAYLKSTLKRSSTEKLKEDLENKPYIAHLILFELKKREEYRNR